uniref:Uncharacterized protein n=1 Tax=Oryza sativa subsp. japonica TaxID=39947 RepID=Q6EQZ1_ORYSJ|nr:hypothetical protein [Oryza sativa Japonica Group]
MPLGPHVRSLLLDSEITRQVRPPRRWISLAAAVQCYRRCTRARGGCCWSAGAVRMQDPPSSLDPAWQRPFEPTSSRMALAMGG